MFVNGGREAVYSGEWKKGKRDGQGTELKRFKAIYTGGWKDGNKNGEGREMDERGKVVRSGVWVNGVWSYSLYPSSLTSDPQTIEELRIGNNSINDNYVTELKLSGLVRLKRIMIGDECFGSVRLVELDGLIELESVMIGKNSITYAKAYRFVRRLITRSDGSCRIVNCPKLKSIQIGDGSFSDYHSFELSNLPALQSIDIGHYCFYYAPSFSLTGLIDWLDCICRSSSITISQSWFRGIHVCSFGCVWEWLNEWIDDSDLPKLQSIDLGESALGGDDRATINEYPFNYKNTLTMRSEIEWNDEWIDLPSLTSFKGEKYNFYRVVA